MGQCIRYDKPLTEECCPDCSIYESKIILLNDKVYQLETLIELNKDKINLLESQIYLLEKYQ